ncbi:hypothetical protein [Chitinophaga nivalis]|uniref:Uncharacterized protein n=1 Tax=Chitinophaga nivalis TaxID=2991709 RepID=A0ABT3INB0_9BACT|nr:hypothetical protein [Chitinophaga nivalis]MCW3464917.1 hypothetical protein [Chitinophaga nivalis]MCW3485391.1 hypothetical protein [Chitinophaga nivalis]
MTRKQRLSYCMGGIFVLVCHLPALAQVSWTDRSRILPDDLRNIPTAILLYHSPTPVYPMLNDDTIGFPGKYIWKHNTSVKTMMADLEVIAAGSYIWSANKGWIPNIKLDRQEFAKEFSCKDGILKQHRLYLFVKNYRYGNKIYPGDALWYVIAKDNNGKTYKGIAIVETEATLKQ